MRKGLDEVFPLSSWNVVNHIIMIPVKTSIIISDIIVALIWFRQECQWFLV